MSKFDPVDGFPPMVHTVIAEWLREHSHPTDNMTVCCVMELIMSNIGVVLEDYSDEIELHIFGKE